jgi:hypothetical protein
MALFDFFCIDKSNLFFEKCKEECKELSVLCCKTQKRPPQYFTLKALNIEVYKFFFHANKQEIDNQRATILPKLSPSQHLLGIFLAEHFFFQLKNILLRSERSTFRKKHRKCGK